MTWSILARDARGRFGVAIASRFFAVGALCVHTRRGVGALAMAAGEAAGGDKRGKQAAALLICAAEAYPFLDLRVDDHPEPLTELLRLYVRSLERYQPFVACLPSRARPAGLTDRAQIEAEIERFHAAFEARGQR